MLWVLFRQGRYFEILDSDQHEIVFTLRSGCNMKDRGTDAAAAAAAGEIGTTKLPTSELLPFVLGDVEIKDPGISSLTGARTMLLPCNVCSRHSHI